MESTKKTTGFLSKLLDNSLFDAMEKEKHQSPVSD
jgi:hypothetical protein